MALSQLDIPVEGAAGCAVNLASYQRGEYWPGRGRLWQAMWYMVSLLFFESGWVPLSSVKSMLLRLFGAEIGRGLVIKPNVRIKYPWKLKVGDYCWIGQDVWIDNLVDVCFGSHVCVSQQAYLCTGGHDYRRSSFDLIVRAIHVGDGAWLGARCTVLPGVAVGASAVVAAGSIVTRDVEPWNVVAGNPARSIGRRR